MGDKNTPLDPDSPNTQLIADLSFNSDKDFVIEKTYPSSFKNTDLKELLERLDIEQIIVTGMKTEYCIDMTIRAASEIGYKIMVASDAHTTSDSIHLSAQYIIDHHNQIFRNAFAKVNTTEELISQF